MVCRTPFLSLRLVTLAASLACFTCLAESQAQNKSKPDAKPKPAPKTAKPPAALTEQVKLEEADVLRKAYILLASGNHDYDGHRARAMGHVKAAFKILDNNVLQHGNAKQKAAAKKGRASVVLAEEAAKQTQMFHEPQVSSDKALGAAAEVLAGARAILAANNQQKVLADVDKAIKEIGIALNIR